MNEKRIRPLEVLLLLVAAPLCVGLTFFWSEVRIGNLLLSYFACDILWSALLFWRCV